MPVEEWRTRLWEEALAEAANVRDWPLAERLQRCFTETRMDRFRLEPGVKVGRIVPSKQHYRRCSPMINGYTEEFCVREPRLQP